MNESRRTGILRLKHLREHTEAVGEDMEVQRERFKALEQREPAKVVSSFNLFQTPVGIASEMISKLGPLDNKRILEPSAGLGRLYAGPPGEWVLVEQDAGCCEHLYTLGVKLIQDDFLLCDERRLGGLFDLIVMNPPFKMGRDVKHILHAYNLLANKGTIVGLCYNGIKQNKHIKPRVDTWEILPEGSFKSEGTKASVAMFTWNK